MTASRISKRPIRSSGVGSIIHGRLHLVVAKKARLAGRSHLSREWGKRLRELRERVVEAADGIGKTGGNGVRSEEQARFGGAHGVRIEAAMSSDRLDEQLVDAIHLGLENRVRGVGERLVRVEVVLALAREHGGVTNTVLGVLDGLIDVHGDDANRADTAGARDEHAGGGGRQRIGRRERHVVGHGPDGLHLRRRADTVGQIEHAARLATRRVDVEQDRSDLGAGERGVQLRGDTGVAGETRFGLEARGSAHQRAVDRDDGNLAARRPKRAGRRRVAYGRSEVGKADARTEHGENDVEFRAMDRQRHAEQARRQMG